MASFSLQNKKNKNSKIYQRGFMNWKYMYMTPQEFVDRPESKNYT